MKQFFATSAFVLVFGFYALNQYLSNSSSLTYAATVPAQTPTNQTAPATIASAAPPPGASSSASGSASTPASSQTLASASGGTSPATQTPAPTPAPVPAPAPAPKPKGQYTDGTYTGPAVDAYYGYVQVQATISGGRLTDVAFIQYPNDRSTSRMINSQAMPLLTQEALQAQSANVDGVSGASETTYGFVQSLSSALAQAKA